MYVRWVHCTKSNLKAYWEKKTEITISPLVQATKNLHEFEDAPEDDVQAFIKLGGATMWWKKIQLWIGRKKSKRGSDFEENTRFAKLAWTSPAAKSQKVKKRLWKWWPRHSSCFADALKKWTPSPKYVQQKVHHSRRDQLWNITYTHHGDFCIRPRSSWRIRDLEQPWGFSRFKRKTTIRSRKKLG